MSSISLRLFGYSMASSDSDRRGALARAFAEHGVGPVMARLEQAKINVYYLKQTESDIEFFKSIYGSVVDDDGVEDEVDDDSKCMDDNEYELWTLKKAALKEMDMTPREEVLESIMYWKERNNVDVNVDTFVECMNALNEKLCKATLTKDVAVINLLVTSMTNVIKSSL